MLRPGGVIVVVAGFSPELAEAAQERGVHASPFLVEPDGPTLARIAELIDAGAVKVEIEEVFPLERAGLAHAKGESNRTRGKLVLDVAP